MATSPRPIRFGAIGCGGMGTCRLQELAKHPLGVEIVAAVDVNPARLDNLANVLGRDDFKRYTGPEDYRRLIDENDLDAVGVFTPHVPHYDHVKYALEKGVHVLCEKPMVCGAANAIEITSLCEEKKLIGMVHYQRHFELKYIKARELIRKGAIGKVLKFYVYMAQDWNGREWRGVPEICGGGQINDSGSHYQDILLWMLDELPVSAQGHIDNFWHDRQLAVEANGSFHVELTNGIVGRVVILSDYPSQGIPYGSFVDEMRILGDKGAITFRGDKVFTHDYASNKTFEEPLERPEGYPLSPVDNFVKLLRHKVRINRVPFIFGSRVALFTETLLRTGHLNGVKVNCEDILKECGHTLDDLRDAK